MLTLRAFGPLDVRDANGQSLTALLSQSKRAALLSYLVLAHRDALYRRDHLLGLFWPELDQQHGRNALSQSLSFLRRELGDGVVVTRGVEEVGVDAAELTSDVAAFEAAVAIGDWAEALEAYRGDLLEGLHVTGAGPFVDWVDRERTRLREAASAAAWKLAHERIGAGRLTEAERVAQRALLLVPTDESRVRAFIEALAGAGDRAAALRFYERFREVLAEELEVEPAPETVAVVEAVRGRSGVAAIPDNGVATSPAEEVAPAARASQRPDLASAEIVSSATTSRRRRGIAVAGVSALLVCVAIVARLLPRGSLPSDAFVVAVLPFVNETGEDSLDWIGSWASEHVTHGIIETELVQVVPFRDVALSASTLEKVDDPSAALERTWPRETGATLAVRGAYYLLGDSLGFRVVVVDARGRDRADPEAILGSVQEAAGALGRLQVSVVRAVVGIVAPGSILSFATEGRRPPDPEALRLTLEGWEIALQGARWEKGLPYARRAHDLDPDYFTPQYLTLVLLRNVERFEEADSICAGLEARMVQWTRVERLTTDWICADVRGRRSDALAASVRLTAFYPPNTTLLGMEYMRVNRPRDAIAAFLRFDLDAGRIARAWAPHQFTYHAEAHHVLGEYETELQVAEEGLRRSPGNRWLLRTRARALIGLGRLEEARSLLDETVAHFGPDMSPAALLRWTGMEADVHGYSGLADELYARVLTWHDSRSAEEQGSADNRRGRAETLLLLTRYDEARPILESLAAEYPDNLDDRGRLGVLHARQRDTTGAHAVSTVLEHWPGRYLHGRNTLWRARIAAALGEPEWAVELLQRAHEEGWAIWDYPHWDAYLRDLRGHPSFEEFLRPKG